jgi:hypothetical protein
MVAVTQAAVAWAQALNDVKCMIALCADTPTAGCLVQLLFSTYAWRQAKVA